MEECGERNEGTTVIDDLLHRHRRDGAGSATAEEEEEASKKRKIVDNGVVVELGSLGVDERSTAKRSSAAENGNRSPEDSPSLSSSSSCCSSCNDQSSDLRKEGLKLLDLEAKRNFDSETADSTSINKTKFSRETTPSSVLFTNSEEITEQSSLAEKKYPPMEEIEEFFAEAEKSEQKRFAEKYNYDIVKDLPLEGRYQWVSLKP